MSHSKQFVFIFACRRGSSSRIRLLLWRSQIDISHVFSCLNTRSRRNNGSGAVIVVMEWAIIKSLSDLMICHAAEIVPWVLDHRRSAHLHWPSLEMQLLCWAHTMQGTALFTFLSHRQLINNVFNLVKLFMNALVWLNVIFSSVIGWNTWSKEILNSSLLAGVREFGLTPLLVDRW